ncbi:hypothetical protein ACN2MM_14380 [Alkalilimnicola ehrlichii MLHE-1]|uniref:Uncharacterized protein n=1 Tax=Alkalilimnicola ehrlichii (strain ATCC BAA-1101 / DSM 17681 / MLHE-1) TaxID=187272 RepID=Q0A530_ALKEH|nr:hypothetical protein [Alkalilimnicola ehrlichii]ABI58057.1 hypothetical protein Mlg_2717 [Alkalilimnicola ehrlichii MLHE-1]
MDQDSQKHAIDSLRDWSKWLIGVDFAAATGCVVVLQSADPGGVARLLLVLAISAFALSVLCAIVLTRVLASVVERLPLTGGDGRPVSIAAYRLGGGLLTVGGLASAQIVLMALGGGLLIGWIVV